MALTLAFDVYGTLIDTHGVVEALRPRLGSRALAFARAWRDKQLEYAFRRTAMGRYVDFSVCVEQALTYTAQAFGVTLGEGERGELLAAYQRLPAMSDAEPGLAALHGAGYCSYAFSNGSREAVSKLLGDSGLRPYVHDIVSVEEAGAFKPNPAVYQLFLERTGAAAERTWLVSSNAFDVIGALSAGWQAAWVRRLPDAIFDPWGVEPTVTVATLNELPQALPTPGGAAAGGVRRG